ncbi:carbohydrate kinase family protein [Massilia sp. S19_KUP03_FR1]|uniref:carbohydrate kinase family protein n=1 Tax=Massilia sp. S19_KUP03_FR1 TaxID=3025503 RepID=UPI002FCDC991
MDAALNFPAQRRYDLLAFGDPTLDLLFTVTRAPAADQKVLGRRLPPAAGGTVANVACAAALLDRPTLAYGRVAADGDGQFLRRAYQRFGVDTACLRDVDGAVSPTALVMIEASGEKALVYAPMPGPLLERASFAAAAAQCRMVYAMPYDLAEFDEVHALARAAGCALAIDIEAAMVSGPDQLQYLLARCDLAFMNDTTYRAIMGAPPEAGQQAALLAHGARMLVVSCGARGAMLAAPGLALAQAAFAAEVVDSTGAGDSFNGAFLAALLEGQDSAAALRFACAAGSIAVSAMGARAALPTRVRIAAVLAHA